MRRREEMGENGASTQAGRPKDGVSWHLSDQG